MQAVRTYNRFMIAHFSVASLWQLKLNLALQRGSCACSTGEYGESYSGLIFNSLECFPPFFQLYFSLVLLQGFTFHFQTWMRNFPYQNRWYIVSKTYYYVLKTFPFVILCIHSHEILTHKPYDCQNAMHFTQSNAIFWTEWY